MLRSRRTVLPVPSSLPVAMLFCGEVVVPSLSVLNGILLEEGCSKWPPEDPSETSTTLTSVPGRERVPFPGCSVGGLLCRVQLQQRPSSAVSGLSSYPSVPGIQRLPRPATAAAAAAAAAIRTAGVRPAMARVCHHRASNTAAFDPSVRSPTSTSVWSSVSTDPRDSCSRTRSAATTLGTSIRYDGAAATPAPAPPAPSS